MTKEELEAIGFIDSGRAGFTYGRELNVHFVNGKFNVIFTRFGLPQKLNVDTFEELKTFIKIVNIL